MSSVVIQHCGHPTALWPWALYIDGEMVVSPNGRAWQRKEDALNAAKLIAEGKVAVNRRLGEYTRIGRDRSQTTCSEVMAAIRSMRKANRKKEAST